MMQKTLQNFENMKTSNNKPPGTFPLQIGSTLTVGGGAGALGAINGQQGDKIWQVAPTTKTNNGDPT